MNDVIVLKDLPDEQTLVLQLGTTLDNTNIRQFTDLLTRAMTDGYQKVIIDCSRLGFISSAGIGVIVSKNRLFSSKKRKLLLYDVPEIVMFVLNELDVADLLTIKSNLDAVIARE